MKTLIILLIFSAFLQTTILPIDLVLLILICRAYIKPEKSNLYLAFGFGLLISHLNLTDLGLQSLIYLALVQAIISLSKLFSSASPLLIIPISMTILTLNQMAVSLINKSSLEFIPIIIAGVLSLPTLFLIRLWEERFTVKKEIKLKI